MEKNKKVWVKIRREFQEVELVGRAENVKELIKSELKKYFRSYINLFEWESCSCL